MILMISLMIYLFILIYTVELIKLLIERSKQDEEKWLYYFISNFTFSIF